MTSSIDREIAMQAARWMVEMEEGGISASRSVHLQQWRDANPEHERAWLRIEQFRRLVREVPPDLGMSLLDRPRPSPNRRAVIGALAVCVSAPMAAWLAGDLFWREEGTDYQTATGQQSAVTLSDGSRILLNTSSRANVAYDTRQRLVRLRGGEFMVRTSADIVTPSRPFRVQTQEGLLQALGTRFSVRQQSGFSNLAVFEGAVEVNPFGNPSLQALVRAGERCSFHATGLLTRGPVPSGSDAWVSGVIVARNMPLGALIAELARYRSGLLECDPEVAQKAVSGTFNLKDTDQALALIAQTLNVRIARRTRFWTIVGAPST